MGLSAGVEDCTNPTLYSGTWSFSAFCFPDLSLILLSAAPKGSPNLRFYKHLSNPEDGLIPSKKVKSPLGRVSLDRSVAARRRQTPSPPLVSLSLSVQMCTVNSHRRSFLVTVYLTVSEERQTRYVRLEGLYFQFAGEPELGTYLCSCLVLT